MTSSVRDRLLTSKVGSHLKRPLQAALRRIGYQLTPINVEYEKFFHDLLRQYKVTLLIDVGANQGQYARWVRQTGYNGRITSYEPISRAFQALHQAASNDSLWSTRQAALGSTVGSADIRISANSVSSSLLDMEALHLAAEPSSRVVGRETVKVSTLDVEFAEAPDDERVWLKLDVQGFEDAVLQGGQRLVEKAVVIQSELSIQPLYVGQVSYLEILRQLSVLGFTPVRFVQGFSDPSSGVQLQLDVIAVRLDRLEPQNDVAL